jgi:hypothetical protein
VRDERFLASLPETGATIAARESEVWQLLAADDGYLALCHWNANVDNAWFFTDLRGELRPDGLGLRRPDARRDGVVGRPVGGRAHAAGPASRRAAELFVAEFAAAGGRALDVAHLRTRLFQYIAVMGVAWLLDVPAMLRARLGDPLMGLTRADSRIADDEALRAPLLMLTNVLDLWQRFEFGAMFAELR